MDEKLASRILDYWFQNLSPSDWFTINPDVDVFIFEAFYTDWEKQKSKIAEDFLSSPEEALSAIILFDQFPRNMFRGTAETFATDHLAARIAGKAVKLDFQEDMSAEKQQFLYMPFMHSEDIGHQNKSVALFTALGQKENIKFANNHRDAIAKFGRFPHRNEILGRAMRPGEQEAIDNGMNW